MCGVKLHSPELSCDTDDGKCLMFFHYLKLELKIVARNLILVLCAILRITVPSYLYNNVYG